MFFKNRTMRNWCRAFSFPLDKTLKWLSALLLSLWSLPSLGCSSPLQVILVGIDGAEWSLINPLISGGKLPNFKTLRDEGKSGMLLTTYSNFSPTIWNSIATGKVPHKHGITNFLLRNPQSYYEIPVTSCDRKAASLWNVLSHHHRKVSVVAWWASWPAEEVNGCIVTQRFFLSSFGAGPIGGKWGIGVGGENPEYCKEGRFLTWPESLSGKLKGCLSARVKQAASRSEMGRLLNELKEPEPPHDLSRDLAVLENIFQTDLLVKETVSFLEESEGPFDLSAIYLEGIDVSSHLFWKYFHSEPWEKDPVRKKELPPDFTRYRPVIPLYYEEIDRMLGEILSKAGPNVMVIVLSDHGFGTYLNEFDYNYPLTSLLEVLGFLNRNEEGGVDYSRTECFDYRSNPWESTRTVFLNMKGQYPEGTVSPEEAPALLANLKNALEGLTTHTDKKVILEFSPLDDNSGVRIKINPRLPRTELVSIHGKIVPLSALFPPRTLSGNHRPQGIVGFYGGGIKPGRLAQFSSLDIAPTILALLGIPVALDMDGKPHLQIVEEVSGKITSVDSYDFLLSRDRQKRKGSFVDEALQERLRALGYIQ